MLIENLKNIHDDNKDSIIDFSETVKRRLDFDSNEDEKKNESSLVTDSGANVKISVRIFSDNMIKIPYTAHKINLCVKDLLITKIVKIKNNRGLVIDSKNCQKR